MNDDALTILMGMMVAGPGADTMSGFMAALSYAAARPESFAEMVMTARHWWADPDEVEASSVFRRAGNLMNHDVVGQLAQWWEEAKHATREA